MMARDQKAGPRKVAPFVAIALVLLVGFAFGAAGRPDLPIELADPERVYDPVAAGELLPAGYRPLLDRDQILPVYDPQFVTADAVDWPSDMLVIGVAGTNTAKAYPVTHLNQREMVLDSLEGVPILVSW